MNLHDEPQLALTQPLRIGIDGEALRQPLTGVGRYVFHVGRALERLLPEAEFFAYARCPENELALPSARWRARIETSQMWRRLSSMAWVKWRSHAFIRQDRLDAYWAGRTLLPLLPGHVTTLSAVHDLSRWVLPESMQFEHRWAYRRWLNEDVRRAHHVVANSNGTARRLRELIGVQALVVAHPGVDEHFAQPPGANEAMLADELRRRGLRKPYLVAVATWEPRKNLARLLQAFVGLKRAGQLAGHQLALVGAHGWGTDERQALLDEAAEHGVVGIGYLPDECMPSLYRGAEALVVPSIYEGFGMPVAEALSCGTRVVMSDLPELREAAQGQGIAVAPTVEGLGAGMLEAVASPRPSAPHFVRPFCWTEAARRLAPLLAGGRQPT